MISLSTGPLIVHPEIWTLVFHRKAATRFSRWVACGRYKHVGAYAYVPYLHVWVFFDPHFCGTDIIVCADGPPAQAMIAAWITDCDLVRMRRNPTQYRFPPVLGFCVPAIKRLLGIRCVSLRPDALYRYCLKNGGEPFEAIHGLNAGIRAATA